MNEIRRFGEGPEIRIFSFIRKVGKSFFARFQTSGIGLTSVLFDCRERFGVVKKRFISGYFARFHKTGRIFPDFWNVT